MKRTFWATVCAVAVASTAGATPPTAAPGMYSGIDLLFLSPKLNSANVTDIFYYGDAPGGGEGFGSIDEPLEFAQRVFVGYQGEAGGGMQVRWFTFDNDLEYAGAWENGSEIPLNGDVNLDVDALDIELTQRGNFGIWNLWVTGGVRYGRLDLTEGAINFEDVPAFIYPGRTGTEFEGAGPTVSLQAARDVLWDGVSIFGNARTALLFGDTELSSAFFDESPLIVQNDCVQVWEFQFGTRVQRPVTEAMDLIVGIFWEAQRWDSDSNLLGDLAFHGFGTQVALLY